ncbi:MAG: phosphoribosylanthranilate isomerase [Alphaproteobacteria bacterium]
MAHEGSLRKVSRLVVMGYSGGMAIECKICGLKSARDLETAKAYGARWAGFVHYPASPRHVSLEDAARIVNATGLGARIGGVSVVVDPDDAQIEAIAEIFSPRALQLSGSESIERVADLKSRYSFEVFKALHISGADDFTEVLHYADVADRLLLEAPAPPDGLPGGNAVTLDWVILKDLDLRTPWFLAGGLNPENLARAVAESGAGAVDVSSGVEEGLGVKSRQRIQDFLEVARDCL